jgi:hypothetical protein
MTEEKKESEFKVVDKRRYSSEGEKLDDAVRSERETPVSPKQTSAPEPKNTKASDASKSESQLDFASFLMSLAHQTLVLLGQAPNPETNQMSENIEAAKQTIDILGMLEEKTKGNISKDEELLFTELLSSLRMAYVQKTTKSK